MKFPEKIPVERMEDYHTHYIGKYANMKMGINFGDIKHLSIHRKNFQKKQIGRNIEENMRFFIFLIKTEISQKLNNNLQAQPMLLSLILSLK